MGLLDVVTNKMGSMLSNKGGLIVSPTESGYATENIGALAGNATWYSTIRDLGEKAHRHGVVAYKWSSVVAQSGAEIDIEWSYDGVTFYPAPSSGTGDVSMALRIASGSDKTQVARGQPMGRYWRVRIKAGTDALNADSKLFLHYGSLY